jgi:predicted DNA-binding transcriptional regulator YafY
LRVEPDPTPEEAAAIAAALEALRAREPEDKYALNRSRWRLAGLLGPADPQQMRLEGSLWSYSRWEGMT